MDVNRRFFMAVMAGAGMDPERLLWMPGRKMISIAAPLNVVPVETLFGMPDLLAFNVPMNERVKAMLAIDPGARWMAEGSGTVRFVEDVPGYDFGTSRNGFALPRKPCNYDFGRIVTPGRDVNSAGAYTTKQPIAVEQRMLWGGTRRFTKRATPVTDDMTWEERAFAEHSDF
jgi:hypothetical protein